MTLSAPPVVVAVVGQQPSAVQFALREAKARRRPLRVVHSTGMPAQTTDFYTGINFLSEFRTAGQLVLDDVRRLIEQQAPDQPVDYVLSDATVIQLLEREAETAQILIVGSDDVPFWERLLHTKVAGYVATRVRCPVVVVPERVAPVGWEGDIVVTLDGESSATGPLTFAFEAASTHECALHVLHTTVPGTVTADAETTRVNLVEELAGWQNRFPDVAVLEGVATDAAAPAIVRATENAGLVVMGRPLHYSIPVALSRPLAIRVLNRASCPVAVVPIDYEGQ